MSTSPVLEETTTVEDTAAPTVRVSEIVGDTADLFTPASLAPGQSRRLRLTLGWYDLGIVLLVGASLVAMLFCLLARS